MEVVHSISGLREALKKESEIGFVPTMGNLHRGHLDLVGIAKRHASCVVSSIFVNRLQFGPNEDFDRYPRTFEEDCEKLEKEGVRYLFAPNEAEMYPSPQEVTVSLPAISKELCGAFRPGHFEGMATVVLKLFSIVSPRIAVFGKKDYQQLYLVKKMAEQFNLPVAVIAGETVREEDGLAMSSRNRYLEKNERIEAARLYRSLSEIKNAVEEGADDYSAIEARARGELEGRGWKVDYIEIRDAETLVKPSKKEKRLVALGAARLGRTRLIDNIEICVPE